MTTDHSCRALIAEDEPLLAAALQQALAAAWPQLHIEATVGDGLSAVQQALALRPDVLWFDIRMPGLSGLDAAVEIAEAWPAGEPFPLLVFVTAYDQYAVQAFEAQAVDYVLKPVQPDRLRKTVLKLQQALAMRAPAAQALDHALSQLRELVALPGAASVGVSGGVERLTMIQASAGTQIHLVPIGEVLYFEAADKYVRVLTAEREYLIRTPLKELTEQLDPAAFWQVHRGTLVRGAAIASAQRDEAGRMHLRLHQRPELLPVSRLYMHRFKAM
ncbi:MAG: response regulator transcription factor [Comamonadaceae bacterium]|nr:MAG: response regulator transcription factor [Comamonadaceae bacterium]